MSKPRTLPLPAIILATLLLQLAVPGVAWAEGETPPAEAQPAVEDPGEAVPTVAEILEAAPPETGLLVVDASGAPEPLASEQAAEAMATSDPIWCPGTVGPADLTCTQVLTPTVTDLLNYLNSNKGVYSGAGTIYFTTDYNVNDAYFRGTDTRLSALTNLTINGQATAGNTVSVPVEVTGWLYDVTVTDLDMTGAVGALRVETTGAIQVTNVEITGSGGDGAYLDNTAGTESVSVDTSSFNGNTWTGLDVRSSGDIVLVNVSADSQEDGAYLDASTGSGSITVTASHFSGNTLAGLTAKTADGDLVLNNVTADFNSAAPPIVTTALALAAPSGVAPAEAYGLGLTASAGGAVTVNGGRAQGNEGKGLWIEGTGPVNLNDFTASENASHGAYIHNLGACAAAPISVTATDGTFESNGGYGVFAVLGPNGAFTLAGTPAFTDNVLGDYEVNLDPCPTCEKKGEGKPYNTVNVPESGTPPIPLDCAQYAGTVFVFPSGDRAMLICPVSGEATASPVTGDGLPGPLPAGRSFIGGSSVLLTEGGQPLLALDEGGYLTLVFKIPEEWKGRSLGILYWDPLTDSWVELPAYSTRPDGSPIVHRLHPDAAPDDLMHILGGVRVLGDSVKVKVTFGGTFVLVAR